MGFGRKLAEYRKRSGIKQDEFAERLGINRSYLNEVEREKVNPPKLETILFMIGTLNNLNTEEAINLLLEAGRLPDSQSVLTVAGAEKLVKSLEAFEAAAQAIEPLRKRLREALNAAEQGLLTELIM